MACYRIESLTTPCLVKVVIWSLLAPTFQAFRDPLRHGALSSTRSVSHPEAIDKVAELRVFHEVSKGGVSLHHVILQLHKQFKLIWNVLSAHHIPPVKEPAAASIRVVHGLPHDLDDILRNDGGRHGDVRGGMGDSH